MISFDEYRKLDASAMVELVNKGEVSPDELLLCAHQRYQAINPTINAIITSMFSNASRYLKKHKPTGSLAGVPLVLKDLLGHFPHVPTSAGSRALQFVIQTRPSTIVDRLGKAGGVFIGKSNTPEFGLLATSENDVIGATRNPWNIERTAGGSSGGTAAAVAAGIVPLGTAGDGGGSIRIPASCCGLFGLKPTRGLVPSGPEFGEVWDGAVSEHVITRSVRDSARVLDLLAGIDCVSHTPLAKTKSGYLKNHEKEPGKLKIAYSSTSPLGGSVSASCRLAVEKAAELLTSLGHHVEEAAPALNGDDIVKAYTDIYIAHVTAEIDQLKQNFGFRYTVSSVEPLSYLISRLGQRFSAGDFVASRLIWTRLQEIMHQFNQKYDYWVTPVLADSPYPLGELRASRMERNLANFVNLSGLHHVLPVSILYGFSAEQLSKVPFTQLANLTGQPAMSVPLHWDDNNLPVGIQFIGKPGSELNMLQLAAQLESAQPWFDRVPRI